MKSRYVVYVVLVALSAFTVGQFWPEFLGQAAYAIESGRANAAKEQLKQARDLSEAFQSVTQAIRPSVVSIRSVKRIESSSMTRPGPLSQEPGIDDFYQRFFGLRRGPMAPMPPQIQRGIGSGVIVSEDGYVVTNNHVVDGATEVTVILSDEREFDADVVGTDDKTDIAVLKINASNLLAASLAEADESKPGEWVLAVGAPFGLEYTVTAGIVSATGRSNVGIADYEDFIQTDAAINPGNSGGPLVNLDGDVVGINTAIATRNGGYQGIGFAIPVGMVRTVMDAIVADGKVTRGWLGVTIQDLTNDLASSFGIAGKDGVLIGDVLEDGPAGKAGLQSGDIVLKLDGRDVTDMARFRNKIAATKPGSEVALELWRDGKTLSKQVEIGELKSQSLASSDPTTNADLGVQLREASPELLEQMGLEADINGVVVMQVEPGGVAYDSGLRRGDVILEVNGKDVQRLRQFRSAIGQADLERGVRLQVLTGGFKRFVFLKR